METIFIIVIGILAIWSLLRTSEHKEALKSINDKLAKHKEVINSHAKRGDEHLKALMTLADNLGYCIHIESNFFEKKLVVHKKEPAPKVKKLKVKSRK